MGGSGRWGGVSGFMWLRLAFRGGASVQARQAQLDVFPSSLEAASRQREEVSSATISSSGAAATAAAAAAASSSLPQIAAVVSAAIRRLAAAPPPPALAAASWTTPLALEEPRSGPRGGCQRAAKWRGHEIIKF